MAKITMTSDEPVKLLKLIEQLFPGVKLDVIDQMLAGLQITGNFSITKSHALAGDETLDIVITK